MGWFPSKIKNMNWVKKGILFDTEWAQLPVVDVYSNFYKIYYSTRDENGRSKPKAISISKDLQKILACETIPLPLGQPGSFDSHGIMPSSIYTRKKDGWKFMYYVGWSKRIDIPYWNSIGMAVSIDNGITWKKCSEGPYLSSNPLESGFIGTVEINTSNPHEIYYSSAHWKKFDNSWEPIYDIKISRNGIVGETILPLKENEGGIAAFRPIKNKFYYSKRNKLDYRTNPQNSYKIYSWDPITKQETMELSPSKNEIMCAYPYIIEDTDKYIMFYNSDFGKLGISYAIKWKTSENN
jgi:hypothetical protein